jgi:Na+/H+ antiporter NhaD/arsenite permease-like protein
MRDFGSGDIHGDVTINDHSNNVEYKLLIHCSNQELIHEEKHRISNLKRERARKNKILFKFLGFAAILMLLAAGWYFIQGKFDLVNCLTGGAGGVLALAALSQSDKRTPFEHRQISALEEISLILRDRGVR